MSTARQSTKRLSVVLTVDEVSRVMAHLSDDKWLIAMLLYGGGLRLLESLRLRIKDLDFERGEITVREGKGDKDRVTTMPRAVVPPLQEHFHRVQAIHQQDVADGYRRVELPHALARKCPNANQERCWQFVFPQERRWRNSKTMASAPTYRRITFIAQTTSTSWTVLVGHAELLREAPMKCEICGRTATLARISGHLICQRCNRKIEAETAARLLGGAVPPAMQRQWDKTWQESIVPETNTGEARKPWWKFW